MAKTTRNYVGLARKWRPQTFDDVIGQPRAVDSLRLDVSNGRVKHAYLFSGPRGVGKTSMARILAKAMNCDQGPTPRPCGVCERCRSIADGFDVDTVEIDAATYTKVENIRDLQEGFNRAPLGGRWKIYIIDEVHMLSDSAFNALLKSLEEPPSRVIFVLATTNPEKIPETVQSRCTRVEFRRIAPEDIVKQLGLILDSEKSVRVHEGERDSILEAIAMASEGGLRDAEVALDQLISLGEEEITLERVQQLLGIVESSMLRDCVAAMVGRDTAKLLSIVQDLVDRGRDIQRFVKTLLHYLRDLLVLRVAGSDEDSDAFGVMKSRAGFAEMKRLAQEVTTPFLLNAINQFLTLDERLRGVAPARFLLEFTFVKFTEVDRAIDLEGVMEALSRGRGPSKAAGGTGGTGRSPGRAGPGGRDASPASGSRGAAPSVTPDPTRNRWSGGGTVHASAVDPETPSTRSSMQSSRPATPSTPSAVSQPSSPPPSPATEGAVSEPDNASYIVGLGIQPVGTEDAGVFWANLQQELHQRFIQISTALSAGALLEVQESLIRVGLPSQGSGEMAIMLLRRPDKKRDLESVVSALAGRSVKVQIEAVSPELLGQTGAAGTQPIPSQVSPQVTEAQLPPSSATAQQAPTSPGSRPQTPAFTRDPEAPDDEMEMQPADSVTPSPAGEDIPAWARDAGLSAAQVPMVNFQEAMRRYPELREAVDLVRKAFKASPHDFNGRPIL